MAKTLTTVAVRNEKAGKARREVPDAGCAGLHLVVQPAGTKSWAYRYRFNGKSKKLTLGRVYLGSDEPERVEIDATLTLAGARKLAGEASHLVAKGTDPAKLKQREKVTARQRQANAELLDRDTVEAVAKVFVEKHARQKTREASWTETARIIGLRPDPENPQKLIRTESGGEVLRHWSGRTVHEITRRDVHDLLDGIVARGSPITANRTLAAVRKMFAWAAARDIITASPCIGVSPPAEEVSRDRVLSDQELRLVWLACDRIGRPFGPLVQLLILTLQRRDEVGGMKQGEVDVARSTWVIPKARTKNGIEHEVPLSPQALAIYVDQKVIARNGLVFTSTGETAISGFSRAKRRIDAEIVALLKEANGRGDNSPLPHWTLHDLRRTGASGMARLGINLPVIEKILNHTSGSFRGVAGVYQRYEFSDEKRTALDAWSDFVVGLQSPNSNKVAILRTEGRRRA